MHQVSYILYNCTCSYQRVMLVFRKVLGAYYMNDLLSWIFSLRKENRGWSKLQKHDGNFKLNVCVWGGGGGGGLLKG